MPIKCDTPTDGDLFPFPKARSDDSARPAQQEVATPQSQSDQQTQSGPIDEFPPAEVSSSLRSKRQSNVDRHGAQPETAHAASMGQPESTVLPSRADASWKLSDKRKYMKRYRDFAEGGKRSCYIIYSA